MVRSLPGAVKGAGWQASSSPGRSPHLHPYVVSLSCPTPAACADAPLDCSTAGWSSQLGVKTRKQHTAEHQASRSVW